MIRNKLKYGRNDMVFSFVMEYDDDRNVALLLIVNYLLLGSLKLTATATAGGKQWH